MSKEPKEQIVVESEYNAQEDDDLYDDEYLDDISFYDKNDEDEDEW